MVGSIAHERFEVTSLSFPVGSLDIVETQSIFAYGQRDRFGLAGLQINFRKPFNSL
jgi:hypothetical protein